jgi:hypothetical protein
MRAVPKDTGCCGCCAVPGIREAFDALNRQWAAVGVMRDASGDLRHGKGFRPRHVVALPLMFTSTVSRSLESQAPRTAAR